MVKSRPIQREIIYDSDSIIRSTDRNMGMQMEDSTQYKYEVYHSHPDYQLMLLTEGCVDIVIADRIMTFSQGDVILLGCNLPHYLRVNSRGKGFLVQFPPQLFPSGMDQIPDYTYIHSLLHHSDGGLSFRFDKDLNYHRDFLQVHTATHIDRVCSVLQLLNKLGRQLNDGETISYLSEQIRDESPQIIVAKCKRYLQNNYDRDLTLEQIAAIANQNKTAFCRTFRRETGETIFQYITRLRIEASFKLLRNTNLSISEIAYRCGFSSLPHFNKKFKEMANLSPSKYRSLMIS